MSVKSLENLQHGGSHYKGMAIEPAEYCQKNQLHFCESSAVKYISRHGYKGREEDVKKAIHFCQMVLEMEYGILCEVSYPDKRSNKR